MIQLNYRTCILHQGNMGIQIENMAKNELMPVGGVAEVEGQEGAGQAPFLILMEADGILTGFLKCYVFSALFNP